MKHLKEISLVVFDPLTEEQNVCQRVKYVQINRRTESVEFTTNELEECVPMEVWEAVVQKPYKAVTISLLRLDPKFNPPANWDAGRLARNKQMYSLHGNENVKCMVVNCTSLRHHWPELEQANTDFCFFVGCSLHSGSSTIHVD